MHQPPHQLVIGKALIGKRTIRAAFGSSPHGLAVPSLWMTRQARSSGHDLLPNHSQLASGYSRTVLVLGLACPTPASGKPQSKRPASCAQAGKTACTTGMFWTPAAPSWLGVLHGVATPAAPFLMGRLGAARAYRGGTGLPYELCQHRRSFSEYPHMERDSPTRARPSLGAGR